jgi:hypothetical protein
MNAKLVCILFLSGFTLIHAQDIIYRIDGNEIKAKVVEVDIDKIRYKEFNNLEGPLYVATKAEISRIQYQNGQVEYFSSTTGNPSHSSLSQFPPGLVGQTRTFGIIGYAMAGPVLGLATASAFSEDWITGGILGGMATVGFGVMAPLIAGKARKTREITGVEGLYGARLTAWILYGITMTNAVISLGLNAWEIEVPDASVIALGIMGGVSSVLFGLDAMKTASQSERLVSSIQISPTYYISQNRFGDNIHSLGVVIRF